MGGSESKTDAHSCCCCVVVVVVMVLVEDDKHPMFRSVVSVIRLYGKFLIVEIIPEMKNKISKINFCIKTLSLWV